MKRETKEPDDAPRERHRLDPELAKIRASVPADQYAAASARVFVERINRRRARPRFAIM
jgi:hypothetical protein